MSQTLEISRRERRKLELRARVLAAASELFAAHGCAATTVAAICQRADVAHKTFFNHFPSKRDLLRELAVEGVDELLVDIEQARKRATSTGDRLRAVFERVGESAEEGGPMHRELVTELVHAVHASPSRSEHARKLHDAFGSIVRDGLVAGEVTRRHAPETLTEMILGAYYVLMFDYANLEEFPIRHRATAAARFLADALAPDSEE
jgi:AcrR family transcriptional regulator